MTQIKEKENIVDVIVLLMIILLIAGTVIISVIFFSLVNILSFISGGLISILNFIWLKRLIRKLLSAGKFTKRSGAEWGIKILIIFGLITLLILKTKINILIFVSGLSILPFAVILQSFFGYFKTIGGR
ncbi:MAG: ATP synthase subunit I [Proteobacteria bacterium]|nr:ATP synthase subunit I [Pseudomonadota bacterium]